jgi:hypothetical protein
VPVTAQLGLPNAVRLRVGVCVEAHTGCGFIL